jgi:lipopolysaccharide/colanic/teichoic acid biosynthesis glycosyltransferase
MGRAETLSGRLATDARSPAKPTTPLQTSPRSPWPSAASPWLSPMVAAVGLLGQLLGVAAFEAFGPRSGPLLLVVVADLAVTAVCLRVAVASPRWRTVLVLGDARLADMIIARAPAAGRRVIACLTWSDARHLHPDIGSLPLRFDELLVQREGLGRLGAIAADLRASARRVLVADCVEGSWVEPEGNPFARALPLRARIVKRVLDVLGAALGLLLLSPVLLVTMVAIRLDSPGPALLRQLRVGADGRRFTLLKLRTMFVDNNDSHHLAYVTSLIKGAASRNGGMFKLIDDPRITRVGRFLRRFSFDEAPQLWNVLTGSMSLVGPRPALMAEVELYGPDALNRLRVKPGLTGLWQVSGRCELTFDQMIELDTRYWHDWTLRMELRVLWQTPPAVLSGRGAA